jgi:hypothetical protein
MAYGQFTDYQPLPDVPGAYAFQTAGGKALTFGGPEAEQLKARLDAAKAAQTVAGDNAAPGPPIGQQAIVQNANALVGNALAKGAAQQATPAAPAPMGDRSYVENGINTGIRLDAQGRPYTVAAGTRGISQEQRQKSATQGTPTPISQSESVTGAQPVNQDYLDEKSRLSEDARVNNNTQRDADLKAWEAGQQAANQQALMTAGMADQQQKQVDLYQAEMQKAAGLRDQALKEYTSSRVDPERIFHGDGGAFKRFGAAIAAAAGAYGATVGHTQNFAQQIIDSAINRDVAAQEADIRVKKDASDTALGDLMRKGMSLDQAKNTLRTIQQNYAQQQIGLAKGASGDAQINAHYDALDNDLQRKQADETEAYMQHAHGTATKAVQEQILYPVAATGGGKVYLTPDKARSLAGEKTESEAKTAGTAKTIGEAQLVEQKAAGAGGKPNTEANSDIQGLAALKELQNKDPGGHIFFKPNSALGALASKETHEYMANAETAATQIVQRLSGGKRPNPKLYDQVLEGLTNPREEDRRAFQKALGEQLERKRKADVSNGPIQAPATAEDAAEEAAAP